MTHMLSLLPKSRFEESGVEIPGGLAFLADYRPDAIAEASAGIEGLFMPPSHPRLDADLLARLGSVRIIQTAGAGFDSVDHAAAAKLGLIVCNSPAQNAITVAEHVIGAVICLQRELAYADETIKSGAYAQARERILGRGACELFGATVGIVGLGGIGRALAPRLAAFGATVVASDVFWPEDFAQEHGIRRVNLDELFAVSDIVTLHCPLMDATRGLVDAARLASMKPGAILVNAARGGIVDETALAAALERGGIRGAAIDNFESEIPSPGNPLLRLSPEARRRVLFSPHLAGVTRAAFARLIRQAIGSLENSLRDFPRSSPSMGSRPFAHQHEESRHERQEDRKLRYGSGDYLPSHSGHPSRRARPARGVPRAADARHHHGLAPQHHGGVHLERG